MVTKDTISTRAKALYDILISLRNSPDKTMEYKVFREKLENEPNSGVIWGALVRKHFVKPLGKNGSRTGVILLVEELNLGPCRTIIKEIVNKNRANKGKPLLEENEPAPIQESMEFYSQEDLVGEITELVTKYNKHHSDSPVIVTIKSEVSTTIK